MTETLKFNGFRELSKNEMLDIDGGGWLDVVAATVAAVVIAATPVGAAVAIVYGVSAVAVAAGACIAVGSACVVMDKAIK